MTVTMAGLWAARRYYRNWGATKEEGHAVMCGDGLIHDPAAQATAAEWIGVPVDAVWPHVLDVVLDGDRPATDPTPSIGDVYRLPLSIAGRALSSVAMAVVEVDGRALVLRTLHRDSPFDVTVAWFAEPRWHDKTRLIVRLRIALRHPGDVLVAEAAGPVVALLMRRALARIKSAADAPVDQR